MRLITSPEPWLAGRRPALVAVVGLVVIAVCYIGVNLLGIGLHSYGWFLVNGSIQGSLC